MISDQGCTLYRYTTTQVMLSSQSNNPSLPLNRSIIYDDVSALSCLKVKKSLSKQWLEGEKGDSAACDDCTALVHQITISTLTASRQPETTGERAHIRTSCIANRDNQRKRRSNHPRRGFRLRRKGKWRATCSL